MKISDLIEDLIDIKLSEEYEDEKLDLIFCKKREIENEFELMMDNKLFQKNH